MAATKQEADQAKGKSASDDFRLPTTVVPSHYNLSLAPDLKEKVFTGKAVIDVEVSQPVQKIILNALELEILEAHVIDANGTKITGTVTYDTDKEFAIISLPETLAAGKSKLYTSFKGILNDKLKGFYSSPWADDDGKVHDMATTQFESTDARKAFPCFDEPAFKATYEVELVVPKDLVALSNGRIISETTDAATGKKTVRFKKTMKMSTYLLAFIVGELEPTESVMVNGNELRTWTVPGKKRLTDFSLRVGAFAIDYFEKYFRVKYPDADKCDLIAIPNFASGAMENKDCITFRETALLLDEKTATQAELERVAEVIMHELAHMWFGDLVTMRWWNGIWLNEAFATFMAAKCMDAFKKEWRIWDQFGMDRAAAARVDSLNSTHPIECPVNRPEEAQELFDVISYEKGCAVLYQIEQFIGEEIFRNGITAYLKAHSFANTETHDLWDSLEAACKEAGSHIPVREIMDKWVFTAGHPLLTVSQESGSVEISQQQFKFLPTDSTQLYPVPVTMKFKKANGTVETEKFVLTEKSRKISLGDGFQWIVVNAGGSGFYRVRYSPELALKLTKQVHENLSVIERFNLVSDSWASVRAGFMPVSDYLDLIKQFSQEDDVNVWSIILSSVQAIYYLLSGEARLAFRNFMEELLTPISTKLGWTPKDGETTQMRQLRSSLFSTLGTVGGDAGVQSKASELFAQWKKDKSSVENNLAASLVSVLAYNGDSKRYDEFAQMSKDAKTPQEVIRFLYSLAAFRDLTLLKKTIASCLSDDVKTQDAPYLFASLAMNEVGTEAAWTFLKANWDKMHEAYPDNGMTRMCSAVIPSLDKNGLETEAKEFFATHKIKGGEMAVAQALEQLHVNVLLRDREVGGSNRLSKYILSHYAPAKVK
jgi:puromycin-sensitive aminopeptidase